MSRCLVIYFASLFFMGCESRFYESSPPVVQKNNYSFENRLTQKIELDSNIDDIQNNLLYIKKLFEVFSFFKKITYIEDIFNPIDLIFHINNELKSKIPVPGIDGVIRHASLIIPINVKSELCKKIDVRLETKKIDTPTLNKPALNSQKNKHNLIQANFLIKTCFSMNQFNPFYTVEWNKEEIEFEFKYEVLASLFNLAQGTEAPINSNCKITKNNENLIETINCTNIAHYINKNEYFFIKEILFKNTGDTKITLISDLFENKIKKSSLNLKKLNDDKVLEF